MRHIWMDLGKTISKRAKTCVDAMKEADLAWTVEPREIQVVNGSIIPNKVAIVRKDTNSILGVVNSTYKCIQNTQVFSFLDDIIQKGDLTYYAAGYVGQGEKIWLLTKLNDDIHLSKQDIIHKLILFSNAHDGRGAIRAYFIPLRAKTQTLLNISFGKKIDELYGSDGIQMRHVGKVEERIQSARRIVGLANDFYSVFETYIEKTYNSSFKQKKVELFFTSCFDAYSIESTRTKNTFEKIRQQYQKEIKTFPDSKDSAWAWFNSVVDFIDYDRPSKGKSKFEQISNHLESLFWGSGLLLKQKAWNTISSLIKI